MKKKKRELGKKKKKYLSTYMPVYTYSFLGLGQQLTNLTAAPSRLIKSDLFL